MKPAAMLTALLLVSACASSPTSDTVALPGVVGDWQLVDGTLDGEPFPLVDGFRITMMVAEDGTIGGTAACNGYGGSYVADGEDLIVSEVAHTEMGCQPEVMQSEQAFLSALGQPLTYEVAGGSLLISGEGVTLEFHEIPSVATAELVGTEWTLDALIAGDTVSSAQGDAWVRFDENGTMTGTTGCRELSGTFTVSADELRFTTLSARGECSEELSGQDAQVVAVLEAPRLEIEGNRLTLTTSGDDGISFTAAR